MWNWIAPRQQQHQPARAEWDLEPIPCLGRALTLGCLYNANSGSMVPGLKVWDMEQLAQATRRQQIASESLELKQNMTQSNVAQKLNIKGSMQLELLSGSVKAEGSAQYIADAECSSAAETVTLCYRVLTEYEEIYCQPSNGFPEPQPNLPATHVVAGLHYGGVAFLEFSRSTEHSESKQQAPVGGSLEAEIRQLVSFSGRGELLTDSEQEKKTERIRCRYFGDFLLEQLPTSLKDATDAIRSIKSNPARVPMLAYLMPLDLLLTRNAPLAVGGPMCHSELVSAAVSYYEALSAASSAAARACAFLRASPWTRKAREMEEFCAKLTEHKGNLDTEMRQQLRKVREGSAHDALGEATVSRRFPLSSLKSWSKEAKEATEVLSVYVNKFREMNARILSSSAEKLQFRIEHPLQRRLLVRISIPASTFSFSKESAVQFGCFWNEDMDAFNRQLVRLEQKLAAETDKPVGLMEENSSEEMKLGLEELIDGEWTRCELDE